MDTLNPIPNDQPAPDFTLLDLEGQVHSLSDYHDQIVIINFWSAECPLAKICDSQLLAYLENWKDEITLVTVASNANETLELLLPVAAERGLQIVLYDPDQVVADLYGAQTTPHLFVLDKEMILRYQGAIDDITFRQREATQHYLRDAVEAIRLGEPPEHGQSPPYGCALVRFSPD